MGRRKNKPKNKRKGKVEFGGCINMYERSAIVLERYMEKILKLNKEYNLKRNSENYGELIKEIEDYQTVTERELEVIQEFDDTAKEIENLQQEQEKLYKENKKLEDERAQLFTELGEDAQVLEIKLKKIEGTIEKNNEKLKEIREEFVKYLTDFSKKQKNRNKCEKARRIGEANHISYIKRMHAEFEEIDVKDIVCLKDFINFEKEQVKQEALDIMIKNGRSEKVAFNQEVLKRAIKTRIDIAEKEAECYILVYEKMKKILAEQDTEAIRLNKYKKTLRDTSVKLAFLEAEREYIVGFLDYERMTAISGAKAHRNMMMEACNNFELDIMQIEKLYELINREITNRSTKKGYNQLYNKTYLKHIEDKEKNFEQEVNNVNISMGTVINSNYWRIEGIKNIYNVFQEEVSQKFNKDLSEYKLDETEEGDIEDIEKEEQYKKHLLEEKEEAYQQFKYDEYGSYQEIDKEEKEELRAAFNLGNEEEDEDDEEEDERNYQYQLEDYKFKESYEDQDEGEELEKYEISMKLEQNDEEDREEEDYEDYEEYDEEEEDEFEEEDVIGKIEEKNKLLAHHTIKSHQNENLGRKNTYYTEEDDEQEENDLNYDEEDDYEDYEEDNYEDEEDDYKNNDEIEQPYKNHQVAQYEEYEEYEEYDEDEEEEEDHYKPYQNVKRPYAYRRNSYLEEADDDEEEEEYENIYEYNYDDDEEEYRKQKLQNKTVISFDDEESIDMIIANSRKKSTNRRGNNKGLFNKLFKK